MHLTLDYLQSLFSYCPLTGQFTRRVRRGNAPAGAIAGTRTSHGYIQINIDGKVYYAHKIAWFLCHGEWVMIDHIDGDRSNNNVKNLRPATYSQNGYNRKGRHGKLKGTYFNRLTGRWEGRIQNRYIGSFDTEQLAHEAYFRRAKELGGEFARAA